MTAAAVDGTNQGREILAGMEKRLVGELDARHGERGNRGHERRGDPQLLRRRCFVAQFAGGVFSQLTDGGVKVARHPLEITVDRLAAD